MLNINIAQVVGRTTLQKAFLVYGTSQDVLTTISVNDTEVINGSAVIKEGRLVTRKDMKRFANSVLDNKESGLEFLPYELLAKDDEQFVWWMPAGPQRLFFAARDKGLEKCNGIVDNPSLIFAWTNNDWYVLAIEGSQRPTPDTPLLFAPYFNVNDNHKICIGSTQLPKNNDVLAWTKAFFASNFTHTNFHDKASKLKRRGDRAKLWRDLLNGKITTFPIESLPSANMTLGQFLTSLNAHG